VASSVPYSSWRKHNGIRKRAAHFIMLMDGEDLDMIPIKEIMEVRHTMPSSFL
jgi:hypothetical protein